MLTDSKQTRGASTVRQLRHTDAKTMLTLLNLVTFLRLLAFKKLFLPRDAMHPRYYSHGPVSVRPSQAGVLLKRQNIGSHKQHHTIPQGL